MAPMNDFQRLVEARLEETGVTVDGKEIRVKMSFVRAPGAATGLRRNRAAGRGGDRWTECPLPAGWYALVYEAEERLLAGGRQDVVARPAAGRGAPHRQRRC